MNAFIILDSNFWRDRAAGKIKDPYTFKNNQEKSDWVQSQRFIMYFKNITFEEAKSINRKYIDYLNEHIVPMKNAEKTIDYLCSKGYELYIITNSPAKVIDNKLTKSGLKKYITSVFTAEEVGHMKPHEDFYKNIYNRIGYSQDMLIIGDEVGCDVALGVKHGIDTCWFNCNYDLIEGMNVINAVNCVHYDQKDKIAKEKLYSVIKEKGLVGYAIDNCVALEFINNDIKVVKSNNNMNAYKIIYNDNKIIEEII